MANRCRDDGCVSASLLLNVRLSLAIVGLILAGLGQSSVAQEGVVPGVLYVEFTGLPTFDQVNLSVTGVASAFPVVHHLATKRTLPPEVTRLQNIYRITYSAPVHPEEAVEQVAQLPGVVYAEPLYPAEPQTLPEPNDPLFSTSGLIEPYLNRLQLVDAWDVVKGEEGDVVIAINDGGTDWRHPDLEANVWTNPGEIPGNGIDDDSNGFVDDVHGWNFANGTSDPSPINPDDTHGTRVAGAAAAVTNNGIGMAGTSWNAQFMPINIACAGSSGLCFSSEGIMYASANGADIINASYSSIFRSTTELNVVRAALALGTLVVASASNQRQNLRWIRRRPAYYLETLSVCGTHYARDTNYYNYGYTVDVCAAGRSVVVTYPNNGYTRSNGTSFSAPLVSGIAALVKTAFPAFTPEQIREQIRATADNIDGINNPSLAGLLGRGRVNAYRAVTETDAISVRMTDYNTQDANGDGEYDEGEEVFVTARLKNYLSDIDSWSYEWAADNIHVELLSGSSGGGGAWRSGDYQTLSFSFRWGTSMPYKSLLFFEPKVTAGGRLVTGSDAIRFVANDVEVATHSTPRFYFDITSEGNIGFADFRWTRFTDYPGKVGQGFYHAADHIDRRPFSLAEEVGLLIGTGPESVSGAVFEIPDLFIQNSDFEPLSPLIFSADPEGVQLSRIIFGDSNAASPLGVHITQESRVDLTNGDEDIALLRYTVNNPTTDTLKNLHVGLYANWDIYRWPENGARYDEQEGITYTHHSSPYRTLMGIVPLTENVERHSRSHIWAEFLFQVPNDAWLEISEGIIPPSADPENWIQFNGLGPYEIAPSSEVIAGYAIIYGSNRSDLRQNARRAREMYVAWGKPYAPNAPRVMPAHRALGISWDPPPFHVSPVTGYLISYCEDGTGCENDQGWIETTLTDTVTTIENLVSGTLYQIRAASINSIGFSNWSPVSTGVPITAPPPDAPTALRVTTNFESLTLLWTASVDHGTPVTGYEVEHRTGNDPFSNDNVTINGTRANISGLTNGLVYDLRVRALSDAGPSPYSTIQGAPTATTVTEHHTSKVSVTITSEGNVGHTTFRGDAQSEGLGFVVTTATGAHRDVLYEGGLIIANSADQIFDAVREGASGVQQKDFEAVTQIISAAGERTSTEGTVHLVASSNLRIFQQSYVDDGSENENFLILRIFAEKGNASGDRENIHLGMFLDWSIAQDDLDATGFDAARQVGYVMDDLTSPSLVAGARLLDVNTGHPSLHYSTIDNVAVMGDGDGFSPEEKWHYISGGVQYSDLVNKDVSQVIAAGPFDLDHGGAEVVMALIYGTSVADFLHSADAALELWESTISRSRDHHTSSLTLSITDKGPLGFAWERDIQPTSEAGLWSGRGFVAETLSGSKRNMLRPSVVGSSGLVLATSDSRVSDALAEAPSPSAEHILQEDFVRVPNTILDIRNPGAFTSHVGQIRFVDSGANDPIGVEVNQRSFVDEMSGNEDYVLLRYAIRNISGIRIDNLHAGLAVNWEASPSGSDDYSGFDATQQTGYIMDDEAGNETVVVGTRLLTRGTLHYQVPTRDELFSQGSEGLTSQKKWQLLSGGVDSRMLEREDIFQWTSVGPLSVDPADSAVVAFAVVAGTSVTDFLANADQALLLWEALTVPTGEDKLLTTNAWTLSAPYPHPAAFPVTLRFEAAQPGHVQLTIYDLLGRSIRQILNAHHGSGEHSVAWDGLDDTGSRVASGLYLVRMTAQTEHQTITQSQPLMVVR